MIKDRYWIAFIIVCVVCVCTFSVCSWHSSEEVLNMASTFDDLALFMQGE